MESNLPGAVPLQLPQITNPHLPPVLTAANNIGISHNNISLYLDNYIFVLLHTSHLLLPPQAYVALLAPYSLRETKLQQGEPRILPLWSIVLFAEAYL